MAVLPMFTVKVGYQPLVTVKRSDLPLVSLKGRYLWLVTAKGCYPTVGYRETSTYSKYADAIPFILPLPIAY